jgi:hypothetical protein
MSCSGIIGGWDTTDPDLLMFCAICDDEGTSRSYTFSYDIGTDVFEQEGNSFGIVRGTDAKNLNFGWAHAAGDNPDLLIDPKGSTFFYAFGVNTSGQPQVQRYFWNGTIFSPDNSRTILASSVYDGGGHGFWSPITKRWFWVGVDPVTQSVDILKSDTIDPSGDNWTLIADWVDDKDDADLFILDSADNLFSVSSLLYTPTNTIYVQIRGYRDDTTNEDFLLIAYDIEADAFTTIELGFADGDFDTVPETFNRAFMQYKGDGSGFIATFTSAERDWNASGNEYAFHYFVAEGQLTLGGGGFGMIPIGG